MIILTFGFCRVNKDGHDHSRFFPSILAPHLSVPKASAVGFNLLFSEVSLRHANRASIMEPAANESPNTAGA